MTLTDSKKKQVRVSDASLPGCGWFTLASLLQNAFKKCTSAALRHETDTVGPAGWFDQLHMKAERGKSVDGLMKLAS